MNRLWDMQPWHGYVHKVYEHAWTCVCCLAAIGPRHGYGIGVVAPEAFSRVKVIRRHLQDGRVLRFDKLISVRMIHEKDARNVGEPCVPLYHVAFVVSGPSPQVVQRRARQASYQFWKGVPLDKWHFTDKYQKHTQRKLRIGTLLNHSVGKVDAWPVLVMHDSYDMRSMGSQICPKPMDTRGPVRKVWVPKKWTPWRDDVDASMAWQQAVAGIVGATCTQCKGQLMRNEEVELVMGDACLIDGVVYCRHSKWHVNSSRGWCAPCKEW